jgi:hypothetical protein
MASDRLQTRSAVQGLYGAPPAHAQVFPLHQEYWRAS